METISSMGQNIWQFVYAVNLSNILYDPFNKRKRGLRAKKKSNKEYKKITGNL